MQTNWWENFFHGVALDFWRAAISDEQTRTEADFIQKQLQLSTGAKILDVPCGNGRLTLELARQGFTLTGVDIAAEFIEEAKQKFDGAGLNIDWHQREMRDLPWSAEFDGAFCFGNSFGYLNDDENAEFLRALSKTLKPDARFILDAPAIAECLLPNLQPHRLLEIGGIKTEIKTTYDPNQRRMFNEFAFTRDGVTEGRESSQRIYSYSELVDLVDAAGLKVFQSYSSLTEDAFGPGATRLLLVAEKK
jgi:SAM-dependent methyltransferase